MASLLGTHLVGRPRAPPRIRRTAVSRRRGASARWDRQLVRPAVDDLARTVVAPDLAGGARVVDRAVPPCDRPGRRTLRTDRPAGQRLPGRVQHREQRSSRLELDRLLRDVLVPPGDDDAVPRNRKAADIAWQQFRPPADRRPRPGQTRGSGTACHPRADRRRDRRCCPVPRRWAAIRSSSRTCSSRPRRPSPARVPASPQSCSHRAPAR